MITDKPQLMSKLYQDQYQEALVGQCSLELIESDFRCRIQVKIPSNVCVKMAAMFNRFAGMGNKGAMTLVDESWTRFVKLWSCGKSATFHVECWNGEARLCFSTLLGRPEECKEMPETGSSHFSQAKNVKSGKYSPSKLKRNQLRLQAFLEKKKQESCNKTTESVDEQSPANSVEMNMSKESCSSNTNVLNDPDESDFRIEKNEGDNSPNDEQPPDDVEERNMREESCSNSPETNVLSYQAESDLRIEKNEVDKSSFSQVKTLLRTIDSTWWKSFTCRDCVNMKECSEGYECFAGYWNELTAKEKKRVRKGTLKANSTPGIYVPKNFFENLEDPFVYEIYLEVLGAQAQFEVNFGRQWGSVEHEFLGDLQPGWLFIPIKTIENLRYYLGRFDNASSFPLECPGEVTMTTSTTSSFPLECPAEETTSFHRPFNPEEFLRALVSPDA